MSEAPERIWADMEDRVFFLDGGRSEAMCFEYIRAIVAERQTATSSLDAAAMQRMAAEAIDEAQSTYEKGAAGMAKYEDVSGFFKACAGTAEMIADKVRALPLPTPADRLAEALRLPEVQALVRGLQTIVDSYEASSELHTSYADCAARLYDHARYALRAVTGEARHE